MQKVSTLVEILENILVAEVRYIFIEWEYQKPINTLTIKNCLNKFNENLKFKYVEYLSYCINELNDNQITELFSISFAGAEATFLLRQLTSSLLLTDLLKKEELSNLLLFFVLESMTIFEEFLLLVFIVL